MLETNWSRTKFLLVSMLWFDFILGLIFISHCLKLIIIHYHTPQKGKIRFRPGKKLNHNSYTNVRSRLCEIAELLWVSGFTRGSQCKLYDENLLGAGISVLHPSAVLANLEMILENSLQPDQFSDTSSDCTKFLQHSLLKCHFARKPATWAADGSNSW